MSSIEISIADMRFTSVSDCCELVRILIIINTSASSNLPSSLTFRPLADDPVEGISLTVVQTLRCSLPSQLYQPLDITGLLQAASLWSDPCHFQPQARPYQESFKTQVS